MENLSRAEVEQVVLEVLSTSTGIEVNAMSMDTPLAELHIKSIQVIGISALLEEKLGYAPNFRALIGMEKISDICDYILR